MLKRFGLMIGAVMALALAGAAVAAPVDVTHTILVASASASPSEVATGLMMAAGVLAVPVAEKAELGVPQGFAESKPLEVATPGATMRAKFQVSSIERFEAAEKVKFSAVCKSGGYPNDGIDEDNTFAKWSPSASCEILITNPALHDQFKPGQKFYVDFTPAAG